MTRQKSARVIASCDDRRDTLVESPKDAAVKHWLDHSLVLASSYRVTRPDRVMPTLTRNAAALAGLGAHHALTYESTTEPGRVLVLVAIRTREPVAELLRSRTFFEWFDAVGVADLPAVFAGELLIRLEFDSERATTVSEVVVSMVTSVENVASLRAQVRASTIQLRAAGVRKLLLFNAFDDPNEVMMLVQIDEEGHAHTWLKYSGLAHEWLEKAGIGAYPTVFVGRFLGTVGIYGAAAAVSTDEP